MSGVASSGVAAARAAEGTVLRSSLDTGSPEYRANRDAQLALLGELAAELDKARAGGGPRYVQRHHDHQCGYDEDLGCFDGALQPQGHGKPVSLASRRWNGIFGGRSLAGPNFPWRASSRHWSAVGSSMSK